MAAELLELRFRWCFRHFGKGSKASFAKTAEREGQYIFGEKRLLSD
jgi:hypothetical protein